MKVSDYIVDFCVKNNIRDIFGYPGGMVTHLMESIRLRNNEINNRLLYHEQALSFAACAYSQLKQKPVLVYATSGPGATNLITGIANAYFDSIPVIFITGQVNRNESSHNLKIKQRGFQETNIVDIVNKITKMAVYVDDESQIPALLEQAYKISMSGRRGPVLLDIPMDVLRSNISYNCAKVYNFIEDNNSIKLECDITSFKRPVLLIGAGVKFNMPIGTIRNILDKLNLPVVTSMLAYDILPKNHPLNYGFIGAYGIRAANFIVAKADLVISIGSRLDIRQVGGIRKYFAPKAKILRFDIDSSELTYPIREDDINITSSVRCAFDALLKYDFNVRDWISVCNTIKNRLKKIDKKELQEDIFDKLSSIIPSDAIITTDVGQNQVWVPQYMTNINQFTLFSGGLGSMGYSLPASIGASYATKDKIVISFNGDGGLQMNIQELETIKRDNLPIKIIVFNNNALGMIRHFQEMYFNSNYIATTCSSGFTSPDFTNIAKAYGINSVKIYDVLELGKLDLNNKEPYLIEIMINQDTYVTPKLRFGMPNQDQEPLIPRELFTYLMEL